MCIIIYNHSIIYNWIYNLCRICTVKLENLEILSKMKTSFIILLLFHRTELHYYNNIHLHYYYYYKIQLNRKCRNDVITLTYFSLPRFTKRTFSKYYTEIRTFAIVSRVKTRDAQLVKKLREYPDNSPSQVRQPSSNNFITENSIVFTVVRQRLNIEENSTAR